MYVHTDTQTYRFTDTHTHRHIDTDTHTHIISYTHAYGYKWIDRQINKINKMKYISRQLNTSGPLTETEMSVFSFVSRSECLKVTDLSCWYTLFKSMCLGLRETSN